MVKCPVWIEQWPVPHPNVRGFTWDGSHFWFSKAEDTDDRTILKVDRNGNTLDSFIGPGDSGNFDDLTWDGTYLWGVRHTHIDQFDRSGSLISSFDLDGKIEKAFNISGLTYDGTDLWVANTNPDNIHRVSTDGEVLDTYPTYQVVTGITLHSDGNLWLVDIFEAITAALDLEGNVLVECDSAFDTACRGIASKDGILWEFSTSSEIVYSAKVVPPLRRAQRGDELVANRGARRRSQKGRQSGTQLRRSQRIV